MNEKPLKESLQKRDRTIVVLGLTGITVLSWTYMFSIALREKSMDMGMEMVQRPYPIQVVGQDQWIWWLREGLMFKLLSQDAYTPTFLMNVQADINMLTAEIEFANVNHGKSPFGVFWSS